MDALYSAEETALAIQERIIVAMREKQDFTGEFCAFEAAIAEVDRMRSEVYRMVRQ